MEVGVADHGLIFLPEDCCLGCTRCIFLGGFLICKHKWAIIRKNSNLVLTSIDLCSRHSVLSEPGHA